jgi:hypothetical protein
MVNHVSTQVHFWMFVIQTIRFRSLASGGDLWHDFGTPFVASDTRQAPWKSIGETRLEKDTTNAQSDVFPTGECRLLPH